MSDKRSLKYLVFFSILTIVATIFFLGLFSDKKLNETESIIFAKENIIFSTSEDKEIVLILEIADTPEKRAKGLMGRKELKGTDGMLFIFQEEALNGFWMKDTYIPLSIAFIDKNGKIQEIIDMEVCPEKENQKENCPVYYPEKSYLYALEVPKGFFGQVGIKPGDRMYLQSK